MLHHSFRNGRQWMGALETMADLRLGRKVVAITVFLPKSRTGGQAQLAVSSELELQNADAGLSDEPGVFKRSIRMTIVAIFHGRGYRLPPVET